MPENCARCNKFVGEDRLKYDLDIYHRECGIEELKEDLPDISDRKMQQILDRIDGAEEIQFTRRNGVEVFR